MNKSRAVCTAFLFHRHSYLIMASVRFRYVNVMQLLNTKKVVFMLTVPNASS